MTEDYNDRRADAAADGFDALDRKRIANGADGGTGPITDDILIECESELPKIIETLGDFARLLREGREDIEGGEILRNAAQAHAADAARLLPGMRKTLLYMQYQLEDFAGQ